MILGLRRYNDVCGGDMRKDPFLIFYNIADFLQYTKNLHDKIFHVAPFAGSTKEVIHPYIEIRSIIDDPCVGIKDNIINTYNGYWRSDLYKEYLCPMFGVWTYYLRYFGFVDFLIGCSRDNKKYNPLTTAIIIRESLFDSFAYEKFEC